MKSNKEKMLKELSMNSDLTGSVSTDDSKQASVDIGSSRKSVNKFDPERTDIGESDTFEVVFKFQKVFKDDLFETEKKLGVFISETSKKRIDVIQKVLPKMSKTVILNNIIDTFFVKYGSEVKTAISQKNTSLDELM